MRKCLTNISSFFEFGAVQKCVNLVDLVKSFLTSISFSLLTSIQYYYLLAKIVVNTAENGPLKVCQNQPHVRKTVTTTVGPPGTGKTMLAKAVANQTTASFIRMVGSYVYSNSKLEQIRFYFLICFLTSSNFSRKKSEKINNIRCEISGNLKILDILIVSVKIKFAEIPENVHQNL